MNPQQKWTTIYITAANGQQYAYNPSTGEMWRKRETKQATQAQPHAKGHQEDAKCLR